MVHRESDVDIGIARIALKLSFEMRWSFFFRFFFSFPLFSLSGSPSQPVDHSVAFGPGDVKSRTVFPVGLRDKRISCLPLSERSPGRKDSFFFGGLRQAKRTVRRGTSNAEKTLLYVKLEAEEKTALGLVSRYPLFHLDEKWRSEVYTYVLRMVRI